MSSEREKRSVGKSTIAADQVPSRAGENTAPALAFGATVDASFGSLANQRTEDAGAPRAAEQVELPGRIGRYAILRRLGQGAMGVVYSAYDPDLERKVAIKLVHDSVHGPSLGRQRVMQEAQAMARVSHPNVVHIYEVGEEQGERGGRIFLAMELIPGLSLRKWQEQHPLKDERSLDQRLRLYLQAAMGLSAAHQSGLIHRDFKPDNVIVGDDGRVRVVDFGLARALNPPAAAEQVLGPGSLESESSAPPSCDRLTYAGTIMGTPGYMSPEQVSGEEVDARSDQWSFCAALYEALYGELPFSGRTFEEFADNVLSGKLPEVMPSRLGRGEVPAVIEQALRRGLARDAAARFESMQPLIAALEMGLLPDAETLTSQHLKRSSVIIVPLFLVTLFIYLGLHSSLPQQATTVESGTAVVAWIVLAACLLNFLRVGALVAKQPTYRRRAHFLVVLCSYIAVGRTIGSLYSMMAYDYVLLETLGIIALHFLKLADGGRYYLYSAATCVAAGVLLILLPRLYSEVMIANYIAIAILLAYAHISASRSPAVAQRG